MPVLRAAALGPRAYLKPPMHAARSAHSAGTLETTMAAGAAIPLRRAGSGVFGFTSRAVIGMFEGAGASGIARLLPLQKRFGGW